MISLEDIRLGTDDFVRRFSLRAKNLMWFIGAGSSASAGIPTAGDMIWDFKQQLFISQRRVSRQSVADLSNPVIQAKLQSHIDSSGHLPKEGSPEEYAALFERAYPSEADRRVYLDSKVSGSKTSYGHVALATLMQSGIVRLIWTTNFDALVADACAQVYGTTAALTTVDLDRANLSTAITEERWPVEVKLHGDFRSRRLKNSSDELREQESRLRQLLVDSSKRFGLVVAGYSGRDESIMRAFEEAITKEGSFPAGLFWLYLSESLPEYRVQALVKQAKEAGIEAALVPIENFDEIMRDIVRIIPDLDTRTLNAFGESRKRWSTASTPLGKKDWPIVRLNAVPVTEMPSVCRRVLCGVGGYAEVRAAIGAAGVDFIFARTSNGVLAYGADDHIRAALKGYRITQFDLYTIDPRRLRRDSGERGLLRRALTRSIARGCGLTFQSYRNIDLLSPAAPNDPVWAPLRAFVGPLTGTFRNFSELRWSEGIGVRLDWADERLWLLIEPRTIFEGSNDNNRAAATDFARERTVKRYNRQLNQLIGFWASHLANDTAELRAFGIGDGVDAVFRLSSDTCFSRRIGA